jgi:hypothetical protein
MTPALLQTFREHAGRACERTASGELVFAGAPLDCSVAPNGVADVRTRGAAAGATELLPALRDNPLTGWSSVLTADGRLLRRWRLEPLIWIHPERLRGALQLLVAGHTAPDASAPSEPVLRVIEPFELAPGTEAALAAFLLRQDEAEASPCRHVLRGRSLLDVAIAGPGLERRRERTRREAATLRALALRPDAARALLARLGSSCDERSPDD